MTASSQELKFQRALKKAATVFKDVDISKVSLPIESTQDVLREAASVIAFFDMREKFKEETCRNCNQKFAYSYYITAVKCCSIRCMATLLESMGLSWEPSAPLERRWGRYVPAIVPPVPYEVISEQAPPVVNKEEPVQLANDTKDIIDELLRITQAL